MRHYMYLLLAVILLTACSTTRRVVTTQRDVTKDSAVIHDSIAIRDSVVVRYEWSVKDSVIVRDSTVMVLDQNGNVVSREKYRNTERSRDTDKKDLFSAARTEAAANSKDCHWEKENAIQEETTQTDRKKVGRFILWGFIACLMAFPFILYHISKRQ